MNFTEQELNIISEIYIQLNINFKTRTPISILIAKHNISESTATKGFKFIYKITIHQYRLELAMNYAKVMFSEGHQIKFIKSELGYSYNSSFVKAFKKVHGHIPSYRPPVALIKRQLH
jgi:AraC-like DNA-binding protein